MTLLGWSLSQWAIVLAYHPIDELSLDKALELQNRWSQGYKTNPGEIDFVGFQHPKDMRMAGELFMAVATKENIFLREQAFK